MNHNKGSPVNNSYLNNFLDNLVTNKNNLNEVGENYSL
jgi:hypothetical protein